MALASPQELSVLREFRNKIADLSVLFNEFEENEVWYMAWLRARDLNLKKAEEMIRKSFEWRKVNKIDTLLTAWNPPVDYPTKFPYEISGYDSSHCPIVLAPFGKWDVRTAVDAGEAKTWLKYNQQLSLIVIEDAKRKMRETNTYISQFVVIVDLKGFTLRQLTSKACIEAHMESVRQYEDNYPETLKGGYIINAPKIFAILFNIVKPLLSAHTLSKLQIFDSNDAKWKPALLNNIPADQLPTRYGGTKQRSKLDNIDSGFGDFFGEDDQDLAEVTVAASAQLCLEYNVDTPKSTISWKFKTENLDIGFSVKDSSGKEIVPYQRIDAWKSLNEGSCIVEKAGKYLVIFDNKYSVIRSKQLLYIVTVTKPGEGKYTL